MAAESLLDGVAIVIDDQWEEETTNIGNLLKQIEEKHIPYVPFKKLPDPDTARHFHDISFFLLDWKLDSAELKEATAAGARRPSMLAKEAIRENIDFLNLLKTACFAPIFIFTDDDPETITPILEKEGLYRDGKPNYIFVKSKSELTDGKLFKEIEAWLKTTPSVYVLMEWEKEYGKAKNKLFHDFYKMSPSWPKVLWDNFATDHVNQSRELGEVITRNLHTRMAPYSFDGTYINNTSGEPTPDEIRTVLGGERFIKIVGLHADSIATGDVFKKSGTDVYLNIRPDCDCIARGEIQTIDDVELYLIKGETVTKAWETRNYDKDFGLFPEVISEAIVFSMLDGKSYRFKFQELLKIKWSEIKDKRIGRLLPPYITRIQQRYALYLQRQGLPRTPEKAIIGEVAETHVDLKEGNTSRSFGRALADKIQNAWRHIRRRL